jgi:RNA polymerase sigma-70 factor (ECF subfamily)
MTASDRELRERGLRQAVLAGDERAWRAWYDESYAGLYRYVLWRCGGLREPAEEVVQETWLVAVRRVRRFDPSSAPFAAWLRGIAANVLRNHLRRRHRRGSTGPLPADAPGAAGGEEARERAEAVAAALAALPEHYEAVLRAKYLDGRSVADIAALHGETVKAVESLLTRARQAFREAYEHREGAP